MSKKKTTIVQDSFILGLTLPYFHTLYPAQFAPLATPCP